MSEEVEWGEWGSPTRDQKDCGSCVQFGVLKVLETALKIRTGDKTLDLDYSEQDLMACSGGSCEYGNTVEAALNRLMVGVCDESCCPYQARTTGFGEGRCIEWEKTGIKIKSWARLTNWEDMKAALRLGPVVGTMAVHQSFMNYTSGIYESQGPADPVIGYHCIADMGFSDPKDAVLLLNSWNGWGFTISNNSGFCWIQKSDSEISVEMYSIELDGPIEPQPTPSPCKYGKGSTKIPNFFLWLTHQKGRYYYMNPNKKGDLK